MNIIDGGHDSMFFIIIVFRAYRQAIPDLLVPMICRQFLGFGLTKDKRPLFLERQDLSI